MSHPGGDAPTNNLESVREMQSAFQPLSLMKSFLGGGSGGGKSDSVAQTEINHALSTENTNNLYKMVT